MLGSEVPGVSSALGDTATQCIVSRFTHSPLLCLEGCAFSSGELGLPEEQGKMSGTLKDAKGRRLLPTLGSAEVMGMVGRGRRVSLLHAIVSFISTSLLSHDV